MNATDLKNLVNIVNKERAVKNIPAIVYTVIVAIIGIVGNIAAISFYSLTKTKTTSTYPMILLPANDLCVSILHFISIGFSLHNLNFLYIELFQMYFFNTHALNSGSLLLILIIAIDRYRLVKLMKHFSVKSLAIMVTGVYMYSFTTASKYFFLLDSIPVNITVNNVTFDAVESGVMSRQKPIWYWFTFVMDSMTFVAVILVSALLYWKLFKKLQKHAEKIKVQYVMSMHSSSVRETQFSIEKRTSSLVSMDKTVTQSDNNILELNASKQDRYRQTPNELPSQNKDNKVKGKTTKTSKNRKIQLLLTKMTCWITVASVVSYVPCFIVVVTTKVGESNGVPVWQGLLFRSYMVNTSINPYIIGYFNKEFRLFLKRKLCRCFSR